MKSVDFRAERHKLIAHRALRSPPPAEPPPARPHKPDLLDHLIAQHPLLHHIELLLPSDSPAFPPAAPHLPTYHVSARLSAFLSSDFLLPLLSSGTLTAVSLCTPVDRCNTFSLVSTPSPVQQPATGSTTVHNAATATLTLDDDTYQQLGLPGQPLVSLPGFHVVRLPIQPSLWHPASKHYQRVHTCLAAAAEVQLLVQHCGHSGGQQGLEERLAKAEGVRLKGRVEQAEQRWRSDGPGALPDVSAVWLAGGDDSSASGMLRQQRKDAQQPNDQLDVELTDWLGLVSCRLVDLLPTHSTDVQCTSANPSLSLIDTAFCTSLPLLSSSASASLASIRYTGVLSHGHLWRSLLSHGWSLVTGEAASLPWVCLLASSVADAGSTAVVHGSGNAEDDFCVFLLPGNRYLLYQMANACMPIH